jgi:hypothetical protein
MVTRDSILQAARAEGERHARMWAERKLLDEGKLGELLERFCRRARVSLWVLIPIVVVETVLMVMVWVYDTKGEATTWYAAIVHVFVVAVLAGLVYSIASNLRRWRRILGELGELGGEEGEPSPSGGKA